MKKVGVTSRIIVMENDRINIGNNGFGLFCCIWGEKRKKLFKTDKCGTQIQLNTIDWMN